MSCCIYLAPHASRRAVLWHNGSLETGKWFHRWHTLHIVFSVVPNQNCINMSVFGTIDHLQYIPRNMHTVFCFAVLCCGYTLTDFPISIRLTSLALWQSNDCPSASKATLMNMDKYFMWIHYERFHNHNKAKHNKTVCIFLGIYCTLPYGKPDCCFDIFGSVPE